MPSMIMQHEVDPADKLKKEIGDLSKVEIFNNQILVAVYIRPQKTKSGIYLSEQTVDEDRFQSKIGLVVKKGPTAFIDENDTWFKGLEINESDWVIFRPSDGWQITVNNVLCRMLEDTVVRGRVNHPDYIW